MSTLGCQPGTLATSILPQMSCPNPYSLLLPCAGSGKTLAFLLPLVVRAWRAARRGEPGVKALVVSPTRELAAQTARALARLVEGMALRCCLLAASAAAAGTDFSRVQILPCAA